VSPPPRPTLHLITDPNLPRDRLLDTIRATVANGIDWVHVRDHQATARDLFDLAACIVEICAGSATRVAVNDRVDVALAVGADAVQVGARSLPIDTIRRIAPTLPVGVSVHDIAQAVAAEAVGADWLTFGHVFPTSSHPGEPPRGIGALREVAHAVKRPVIAIGGIGPEEVADVRAAGASGIAVISAITGAKDPGRATRELRALLLG
jgi:thiamine-phosphate pyrophosphorylase